MMYGTAWVITGWTVVGGTVFLFGFLFFYNLTPTPITTTPMPTTTAPKTMSTPSLISSTSPLMTTILSTTEPTTTTQPSNLLQCGVQGNTSIDRDAQPLIGGFLAGILEGKIIGGTTAVPGEWPWIAYLFELQNGPEFGGFCGGALVSHKWVVTAAHCIITNDPSLYGVILGAHIISLPSGSEITSNVTQIITHPQFDPISFNYDVALIELSETIAFTTSIRPVCIVPAGTNTDNDSPPSFAGAVCSTIGWGFTSSPGGQRSDILMQLNLVITPSSLCDIATHIDAQDYGNRPVTPESPKFCAGGQLNEDTCDGDSGGPLVCLHEDGFYYLHGITSYGTEICAQANKPGVYTEVANDVVQSFLNETLFL